MFNLFQGKDLDSTQNSLTSLIHFLPHALYDVIDLAVDSAKVIYTLDLALGSVINDLLTISVPSKLIKFSRASLNASYNDNFDTNWVQTMA